MAAPKKKQNIDSDFIISKFMEYVLEHDGYPKSVYKFCKEFKIKEEEFYKFYGSIDSLKSGVWDEFYHNTIKALHNSQEFEQLSSREKLLSFFYTMFEILTLNRSYVLFVLKENDMPLKNMTQLRGLRSKVRDFAKDLVEADNDEKQFKLTKNPASIYAEGAWIQFLFLLKFWMEDNSAGFEKTDIAIEKSVNTIFDVFDNTPINNILDFGKFLWKERMN